ncbi:MAG: ATP-binding protein [Candidatus Cloacimonetes bacterium]|nr:ATP-binding protein [Candidatus Cloacimonadota bacterium]
MRPFVIETRAVLSELDLVVAKLADVAREAKLNPNLEFIMQLSCEEVFSNICSYAFSDNETDKLTESGRVQINVLVDSDSIQIVFRDNGRYFDPLIETNPDLESSVANRMIGGLGLHFVRHYMDLVAYQRIDDQNVFSMKKNIKQ